MLRPFVLCSDECLVHGFSFPSWLKQGQRSLMLQAGLSTKLDSSVQSTAAQSSIDFKQPAEDKRQHIQSQH